MSRLHPTLSQRRSPKHERLIFAKSGPSFNRPKAAPNLHGSGEKPRKLQSCWCWCFVVRFALPDVCYFS